MFVPQVLRTALTALGDVLTERNAAFEIVVIGGGGLQLLGLIVRPTKDLDVLARDRADRRGARRGRPMGETQDASPEFARFVDQVITHLRGARA